jgi:CheY-like chemotaxis protein/anti-sigma regulatory factor (Ser/Thr protein kinase)
MHFAATEPAEAAPPETHTVLVVDDSAIDRHLAGAIVQKLQGWKATFAGNGVEALAALKEAVPDMVLTDMLMPEMDGLELVQAVRAQYPLVPVILMTAHGSEDIAIQALQRGAASYVPKKLLARDLTETLEQVLALARTNKNQQRVLECLTKQEIDFTLDNDAALVPPLVSFLEERIVRMKLCEPAGLILLGVALHEALTNAIFHGNLELSSAIKEADEQKYHQLAAERRNLPPYRDRRVHLTTTLTREDVTFVIRDEGLGFDPSLLPDPTDPSNLERVSGRGLLLIQTFMDHVEHNTKGNEITMVKRR